MKKLSYMILFLCTFLLLSPFVIKKGIIDRRIQAKEAFETAEKEALAEKTGSAVQEEQPSAEVLPEAEPVPEEPLTELKTPDASDSSYFDDTLFIGDSRTIGLYEYGDLGQAEVFASSGMTIYEIFTLKNGITDENGTAHMLEDMLNSREYRQIYIMLGINELGYDLDRTAVKYKETVEKIRTMQPQADIVIQKNQHVTAAYSAKNPMYCNENINRINAAAEKTAEELGLTCLDANVLFDDETGALDPEKTYDNIHVLGRYYIQWSQWILEQERQRLNDQEKKED